MSASSNLLLISNSTSPPGGYLDHCELEIRGALGEGSRRKVAFVPYARPGGMTHGAYTDLVRGRFAKLGHDIVGIHEGKSPREVIESADAVFVGGGNTFVLARQLQEGDLYIPLKALADSGRLYIGTSAGINIAGGTIANTNDNPIILPWKLGALGLVPFNFKPHYLDPDSRVGRESDETRIFEYHSFDGNNGTVVGLREGAMIRVNQGRPSLVGKNGARVFQKGLEPREVAINGDLSFLF
jgi:dipeptidase E